MQWSGLLAPSCDCPWPLPLVPTPLEAQQEPSPMGIQRVPMMGNPSRTTGCSKYAGTILVLKDFIIPSALDVKATKCIGALVLVCWLG